MRRREVLATVPIAAIGGCTIGGEPPDRDGFELSLPSTEDDNLPQRYTCDGAGDSPPLRIDRVPAEATSIAIIGEWLRSYTPRTIWLLWGLSAEESLELPAGLPNDPRLDSLGEAVQGQNDERSIGYRPPCHETPDHQEYRFIAFALPEEPDLTPGDDRDAFDSAIESQLSDAASTTLRVRYERF